MFLICADAEDARRPTAYAAIGLEHGRLLEAARRALQDRDDLLAIVSHDLKNPLGAIVMSASMLERSAPEGAEGEPVRRHAARVQRAAERMSSLIRDLLDMASLTSGHFTVDARAMAADAPVLETLDLFRPLAQEKGILLESGADVAECPPIAADRGRLLQTFSNLVGNAIQYSPAGGRITLGAVPDGGCVKYYVRDEGPGIPEAQLPHIFERWWRGAKNTPAVNVGLGLSIAKGIVEAHGGRIWAESRAGGGSTFWFTVPVSAPTSAPARP